MLMVLIYSAEAYIHYRNTRQLYRSLERRCGCDNVEKTKYKVKPRGQNAGKKAKALPLQAWSGPAGSRELKLPDFMTTAQEGGKVVSLMHRLPLPPGNTPGTNFC
jgi:hypothetical protein